MIEGNLSDYNRCLNVMSHPSEDWPQKFKFLRSKGIQEKIILKSLSTVTKQQYSRYLYTGKKDRWCREKALS